jgi:hypothetical protein
MAIKHSSVAAKIEDLNLVEFLKYTDSRGIEQSIRISDLNGLRVIENDNVPFTAATGSVAAKYTTFLLGAGSIAYAPAPVLYGNPMFEFARDAKTNGGQSQFISRVRETLHPYGFKFTKGDVVSPTDAELAAVANWGIAVPDETLKLIPVARIISNVD